MEIKRCKHMVVTIDREGFIKKRICNEVADQINHWCKEHRQAQEIMEVGKLAGYPRLVTNEGQDQERELVGAGFDNWEEYAIFSLCKIPILKNRREVIAPTGFEKITPFLNALIVKNRAVEAQEQATSKQHVASTVRARKPSEIDSSRDLDGVFSEAWEVPIKKPAPVAAPGKVAVLDREEDIDIDPDEVFDF